MVVAAAVVLLMSESGLGADPHRAGGVHSQPVGTPGPAGAVPVQASLPQATVRIPAPGAPLTVPRSFLGISTEYWTIPVWANHLSLLGRVLSTITPHGPMVLRIGGSSADQAFWAPSSSGSGRRGWVRSGGSSIASACA